MTELLAAVTKAGGVAAFPARQTIWPTELEVGELGKTGSDGFLYKVLTDNEVHAATVKAKGVDAYSFALGSIRHVFYMSANGHDLPWPAEPPHKEFCVGQQVWLHAGFDPPLIRLVNGGPRESQWDVQGAFINKVVKRPDPKSPLYQVDPTLLFQPNVFRPATRVWWYDQGVKDVTATWRGLKFRNGQEIESFGESRKVEIYRPTLYGFDYQSPRSFMRVSARIQLSSKMPKKQRFSRSRFRSLSPRPKEFEFLPFGMITNLFQVTRPGTYTLAVQLRYWTVTNNYATPFLSPPVRLPVIVRETALQIASPPAPGKEKRAGSK